ncbi:RNA polymerase sigma factor [Herpetosiphon llansteffanensis]|uniref:RNA polymerase sigma factor n=1 Tax=Herpetosiphon llansteffanensis TaxID=2094568 RepID=UPI001F0C3DA7|nr:sigma-70 family RNA polymerase sigma factor [Herpetosiphon llansteffanensis]
MVFARPTFRLGTVKASPKPSWFAQMGSQIGLWWAASTIRSDSSDVVPINDNQRPMPGDPLGDNVLIRRIAQGDEQALSQLYDRYAATVMGIALKIVRQREIAEEITQEAFWRVWQRASTFDNSRGNCAPWLFGIARNLSIDELRRRAARPQAAYDDPERPLLESIADDADIEEVVWLGEQRSVVRSAMQSLSAEQREALELAYFSGLTQREIADKLGNPLGTIKTRVRLGLLKLRDLLGTHQWNE